MRRKLADEDALIARMVDGTRGDGLVAEAELCRVLRGTGPTALDVYKGRCRNLPVKEKRMERPTFCADLDAHVILVRLRKEGRRPTALCVYRDMERRKLVYGSRTAGGYGYWPDRSQRARHGALMP